MKNIFSAEETAPELDPSFAAQAAQQRGGLPQAPPTDANLPASAPVPLRIPEHEKMAERAGMRVDWKSTPIE